MSDEEFGLAAVFEASAYNTGGYTVKVCHNSTGTLVSEITTGVTPNPKHFGLFLAANTGGPVSVCDLGLCIPYDGTNDTFTYTKGIPVLWTKTAGLINVKDEPNEGTINLSLVDHVYIADPDLAPYGLAAEQIMQGVTYQWNTVVNAGKLTEFSNIDLTFAAVNNATDGKTVGYVAKSQICNYNLPSPYFYEYVNTAYSPIIQDGAIINIPVGVLPDSNDAAEAFVAFLLSNVTNDGQWLLINKFCYQSIAPSAPVVESESATPWARSAK
jgi:molybdate transport system substrate-binding protein